MGMAMGMIPAAKGTRKGSHRTGTVLPAALGSHTELPAASPVVPSGTDRPRPGSPRLRGEFGVQCTHRAMKRASGGRCSSGRCHTGPGDRGRRDRLCPLVPANRNRPGGGAAAAALREQQQSDLGLIHRAAPSLVTTESCACLSFPSCPRSVRGLKSSTRALWASAIHIYMGGKEGWDAFKNYSVQK